MRAYSALLLFENLLDYIPSDNPDLLNLAKAILEPNLPIVESDCGTTLGKFANVNFEVEGQVELSTDVRISKSRVEFLLSQGIYEVATRHTSTCISEGGICAKCYAATYPTEEYPEVNSRVNVLPEYLVNSEIIAAKTDSKQYPLTTDNTTYDKIYAYVNGELMENGVDYIVEDDVFTLLDFPSESLNIVVKCIKYDTFPFIVWLANTFSGSIFGMDPLPHQKLPVRSLLLASLLTENRLQLVNEQLKEIPTIPEDSLNYSETIKDPLERGLFMLALYCIYSNVTT
jgi:hypothetical protein